MQNRKLLPYVALAIGITALSLSAMFVRWSTAPGPITGFYRLLFSTILLAPIFIYRQRTSAALEIPWIWFPLVAGLFTACDFAVWNSSLALTTASNATLLGNTSPLWVALVAFFLLREKLRGIFWLGLTLALVGAALIMGGDFLFHPTFGLGDLMACIAAVFYAAYQLITQRGRQHIDPFRYVWLVGVSATMAMFLINLALHNSFTGYSNQTWLVFIATALISQTIGYFSITYALGHLPASVVSPTLIGQPILTTILAIPLLGEIPNFTQWLGGAIALAGIYIVNQSHGRGAEEVSNG